MQTELSENILHDSDINFKYRNVEVTRAVVRFNPLYVE